MVKMSVRMIFTAKISSLIQSHRAFNPASETARDAWVFLTLPCATCYVPGLAPTPSEDNVQGSGSLLILKALIESILDHQSGFSAMVSNKPGGSLLQPLLSPQKWPRFWERVGNVFFFLSFSAWLIKVTKTVLSVCGVNLTYTSQGAPFHLDRF